MKKIDIELIAGVVSLISGLGLKFLKKDNIKSWRSSIIGSNGNKGLLSILLIISGIVLIAVRVDDRLYPEKEETPVTKNLGE